MMICPKCGARQKVAPICEKCGIVVGKFVKKKRVVKRESPQKIRERKGQIIGKVVASHEQYADEEDVYEDAETYKEEVIEEEEPAEIKIIEFELNPVYFKFDSYALTEKGQVKLDKIASLLKDFTNIKAELHGHADAKGSSEYNQRLSEKRA